MLYDGVCNGGFDQGLCDAEWDNHPDNPANDNNYDADYLYDLQKDMQGER